ncbi:MAG TPA: ATP-binding protein, partial [Candidatus Wallbacteria bacterium]|nr:ATP-binding protein [Candidatus Wallbacteria bacterium]
MKIRYLIDPKIENSYTGASLRINQILSNLVSNAIKFTPRGEVTLSIYEESRGKSVSIVKITVADTGIGISRDRIDEIFDPFHQLENSYTKKYAGIGLGLSIVKNLVSLLDGEIKVESELNRGTSFILKLPLERNPD